MVQITRLMALTTLGITPTQNEATALISVLDTTDYAGQGIPTDGTYTIGGYLRIQLSGPSGLVTIYDNLGGGTADIDPNVSLTSTSTINLPLGTDGLSLPGTYIYTYNVVVTQTVPGDIADVTDTFTYTYDLDKVNVSMTRFINCQSSTISSYDTTDYGVYATTISRAHTLYPPPASGLSNQTVSSTLNVYPPNIATTTWTQGVVTDVTYTLTDGLLVQRQISGSAEFAVVCDVGISSILCCVDKLMKMWMSFECKNPARYSEMYEQTIKPMLAAMQMYDESLIAGDTNKASYWYDKIVSISGCDDSCGCVSGDPEIVYPSGVAGNNFVVDSPDSSITVTSDISGSTVTYHVQLSAALQSIIGNLYNTTVSGSTYIDVVSSGTNPKDYQVSLNGTAVSGLVQRMSYKFSVDTSIVGPNFIGMNTDTLLNFGNNFNSFGSQTFAFGQNSPNQPTDLAIITITDAMVDSSIPFMVSAQVNSYDTTLQVTAQKTIEAEVLFVNTVSNIITIRLYNVGTGQPYTLSDIQTQYPIVTVGVTILS